MAASATEGDASYGSGVPARSLHADATELSLEDFEDRHGSHFLLLGNAELSRPAGPSSTVVQIVGYGDDTFETSDQIPLVVYPARRSGRAVGHLVTIGRTSNNDIAVPDVSVSRFHAYLKPGPGETVQIQDAKSTNGTSVNGAPVPAQGLGDATDLKSGDTIRVGQVDFTFLEAARLVDFVAALES